MANKNKLNNLTNRLFLQSWEWGKFQKSTGNKIFRIGIEENGQLIAVSNLIKKKLIINKNYLYCPGGLINNYQLSPQREGQAIIPAKRGTSNYQFNSKFKTWPEQKRGVQNSKQILQLLFNEIQAIAEKENAIFLRFESQFEFQSSIINCQSKIAKTIDVQPSKTLILDLDKSEDELLKKMHQKTRYNIRLAEKRGVKIMEAGKSQFEDFWNLMQETSKKDNFRLHNKKYYQKMLDQPLIKLFLAKYKNHTIAANIVVFFKNTATYLHGASSFEYRNVMAPYILQWHCIKLAKKLGHKYYDFYGIDEKKWPGVTRFKNGFSGNKIQYPGTFDLVFNKKWYLFYKILRKLKSLYNA